MRPNRGMERTSFWLEKAHIKYLSALAAINKTSAAAVLRHTLNKEMGRQPEDVDLHDVVEGDET